MAKASATKPGITKASSSSASPSTSSKVPVKKVVPVAAPTPSPLPPTKFAKVTTADKKVSVEAKKKNTGKGVGGKYLWWW